MQAGTVSSRAGDETKVRWHETIFEPREDVPKLALSISQTNETTG